MRFEQRQTWKNHLGNQTVQPLRIYRPESIDDVVALVEEAARVRWTVRAAGSGHSWSDVALTPGFLVDTSGISQVLDLEPALLRPDVDPKVLVRAEGGIRLRELNAYLDAHGLALSNMGGYDAQTVAGVISTSTHGSGITFGPLPEQVRSLDLVAGRGSVYRVEPRDGPTDPQRFATHYPRRRLVQDDDWFHAVVVGMGCMGVIYAATLAVEPKYWLKEVRVLSTWPQVKADLQAGRVLRDNRHYEFLFNPYAVNGTHRCLVTTRNRAPEPVGKPREKLERNPLTEIAASLPITAKIMQFLFDRVPRFTPELIDRFALEGLVDDDYTNVSYKVLNVGASNKLPALSMEIGVPMEDERHLRAVERVMAIAEEYGRVGDVYETAPVSVRFVKASEAWMSMMQGRDTAMLELIMLGGTEGGFELLGAYEEALYPLGGRSHWGQVNYLAGPDLMDAMYPRFADWLRIRQLVDPDGTFDSPFTKRVGISRRGFPPVATGITQ